MIVFVTLERDHAQELLDAAPEDEFLTHAQRALREGLHRALTASDAPTCGPHGCS